MDFLGAVSLAQIRVLLVPVGDIHLEVFEKWAAEIRDFKEIKLSDIPGDSRDDRARFMPNPLANGSLLMTYPTHPPSDSLAPLSVFRPSEFPLGILGIAACSQNDSLSSIFAHFNGLFSRIFPRDAAFPIARNCFVFEEGDGNTNLNVGSHLPGLVVIPSLMGNKKLYLGTLLAEMCSNILGGFSTIVRDLESTTGSEWLNSGHFGKFPSMHSRASLEHDRFSLPVQHSTPELNENGFPARLDDGNKFGLKRASTAGPGFPHNNRVSSLTMSQAKKRQSTVPSVISHARLYKLLGDLFLLAGRTMDANIWYNEAIALSRQPQDMLWQASALEGMATAGIVDIWNNDKNLTATTNVVSQQFGDILEKFTQASNLYMKYAANLDNGEDYTALTFAFVTATLRQATLLVNVWSGNDPTSIPHLHQSVNLSGRNSDTQLNRLSTRTGVPRSEIAMLLSQSHGPWLLHLHPRERLEIFRYMANAYLFIGYRRKQVYILRELISCIMDSMVHRKEEYPTKTNESVLSPNAYGEYSRSAQSDAIGVREVGDTQGNESVLQLVRYACMVHGIDLNTVCFTNDSEVAREQEKSHTRAMVVRQWTDIQESLIKEALVVAEFLPDFTSVTLFALSSLSSLGPHLDPDDQYYLYTTAARSLAAIKRRGESRVLKFWISNIIVTLRLKPADFTRIPLEKPFSDLGRELLPADAIKVDPFLYNPRKYSERNSKLLAVQNEPIELLVTMRNPYAIGLEVSQIGLSTDGVPFDSDSISVVLPAGATHTLTLSGKARESGQLIIRGCTIRIPGTEALECLVPLYGEEDERRRSQLNFLAASELDRPKPISLNDRMSLDSRKQEDQETRPPLNPRFLELKVVPEQPLLRVRRSTLTNGSVMLYDGETSYLRLTVENVSSLPINFLELNFDDSTQREANEALSDTDVDTFHAYEIEYSIVKHPAFVWDRADANLVIPPGRESVIAVKCFGKFGCSSGVINISYSYTNRHQDSAQAEFPFFYTRQLLYPVLFSVYQMLECQNMSVMPLFSISADLNGQAGEDTWRSTFKDLDEYRWCMLTLDVHNAYSIPFKVTLRHGKTQSTCIISPGSTNRLLLPIERFSLPETVTSEAIPSLLNRQFMVTDVGNDGNKHKKDLFWYREELLKRIDAQWKEANGSRHGILSLRGQRFTLPMLKVLRIDPIQVTLGIEEIESDPAAKPKVEKVGSLLSVPANHPVLLCARVQNHAGAAQSLSLSYAVEPDDHVVHDGILTGIPVGKLEDEEEKVTRSGLVFTAEGDYDIIAQVRVVDLKGGYVGGSSRLRLSVREFG